MAKYRPQEPEWVHAERALLGSVLIDPGAYEEASTVVAPSDLTYVHEEIWSAIKDMLANGREVDAITIAAELAAKGRLEAVGGTTYLLSLPNCVPSSCRARSYAEAVRKFADQRKLGLTIKEAQVAFRNGNPEDARASLASVATPPEHGEHWATSFLSLASHGWLDSPPPPRNVLLRAPSGAPAMLRGEVAILASAGGVGKTQAATQLALAIAHGGTWLGPKGWRAPYSGHVAAFFGEESDVSMWSRFFDAGVYMTPDEKARVASNIHAVPLRGVDCKLLTEDGKPTAFALDLRSRLRNAGHDWSLIIIDPSSRFMGVECETNASLATAYVEELERLSQMPGNPLVLATHHTTKAGRNTRDASAVAVRGSSALVDGARWVGNLVEEKGEGHERFSLVVDKCNSTKHPPRLLVERQENGVLHAIDAPPAKES